MPEAVAFFGAQHWFSIKPAVVSLDENLDQQEGHWNGDKLMLDGSNVNSHREKN